jgi:hypothetical protein
MDGNQLLLATARDCFYFVTRFFEVIKLSAPHIYHSALELSPRSAIVRKLYHHHRPHPTPWVVHGVPISWNQPLTIQTNHKSAVWSPCSKSLAVATPNNVEIWDILTLEKHSTLQPPSPSHKLQDTPKQDIPKHSPYGIAYSPSGHSLACYFSPSTAIIIWDIQTGGVVSKIECGAVGTAFESLVWSSDGKTIGAIFAGSQDWVVCVCDVTMGTMVSPGTLQSLHRPYLWPHNKSFQVLTMLSHKYFNFDIYEVGPTLLRIESFSIMLSTRNKPQTISFSPVTRWISIITNKHHEQNTLLAFSSQLSGALLMEVGNFHGNCFSPNGNLLAASGKAGIHVWKCDSNSYTLWKEIPFQDGPRELSWGLQFSPTLFSVLISREGFLEVVHLDDLKVNPPAEPSPQYGKISTDGTYIVTACCDEPRITITNLLSQTPSWFIDTGFRIHGLALTGNVLLVDGTDDVGGDEIVTWRLTAEGAVEGVLGDEEAGCSHEIWSCQRPTCGAVELLVTGDTGIIRITGTHLLYYNTNTGELYKSAPIQVPTLSTSWHNLGDLSFHTNLHYHSFQECNDHLKDTQPASIPSYEEGWVKYPEGEHPHRFWLPVHWRADHGGNAYWLNDITTLWLQGSKLAVIKF